MGIRCQATYRALFKRDNDVGVHHWIEIKEPEKSTLFTKQEEGLWEECMSRSRQGYYRLQKKDKLSATLSNKMECKLYSMRRLFWMLSKYNSYTKQGNSPFDGLILNKATIQKTLNTFPKRIPSWMAFKRFIAKYAKSIVILPILIAILVFAIVVAFNPFLFEENTEVIQDNHNPKYFPVIAKWESPSGHQFTNSVDYRENVYIVSASEGSTMNLFMVVLSCLEICSVIAAVIVSFLFYKYNEHGMTIEKECVEEGLTYKMVMEELLKDEKPLDDMSKQILQERGISSQEIANYCFYSNATLTTDKVSELFKKVKEYSTKASFRKVILATLDEICLIEPSAILEGSTCPMETL